MDNLVKFSTDKTPELSTVGYFYVSDLWYHINRTQHLNCMIYVTSGTLYLTENEVDYEIDEGQVFFLKADLHHYGKKATSAGTSWYWVSFYPYENVDNSFIELLKQQTIIDKEAFCKKLQNMYKLFQSNQPYKREQISSQIHEIFFMLLNQQYNNCEQPPHGVIVNAINNLLENNIYSDFDSKKISDNLNLNYSYLGKLYKETMGITISYHFSTLKIQEAINLMQTSNMNIAEISDKLNFPNPYYFSRVFKKITGISPSKYKNRSIKYSQ